MAKKILTQEDLDNNPELIDQGLKVGDEIDIPDEEVSSEETNDNEKTDIPAKAADDGNGANHPPGGPGKP
jgi:hypothetical protein